MGLIVIGYSILQDGEIWTFSVRAFDSALPERTIIVNYDGFAEGYYHEKHVNLIYGNDVCNVCCHYYIDAHVDNWVKISTEVQHYTQM